MQLAATGEIPDVRNALVKQDVAHPTRVQQPIAIAFVKTKLWECTGFDLRPEAQIASRR